MADAYTHIQKNPIQQNLNLTQNKQKMYLMQKTQGIAVGSNRQREKVHSRQIIAKKPNNFYGITEYPISFSSMHTQICM